MVRRPISDWLVRVLVGAALLAGTAARATGPADSSSRTSSFATTRWGSPSTCLVTSTSSTPASR